MYRKKRIRKKPLLKKKMFKRKNFVVRGNVGTYYKRRYDAKIASLSKINSAIVHFKDTRKKGAAKINYNSQTIVSTSGHRRWYSVKVGSRFYWRDKKKKKNYTRSYAYWRGYKE